MSPSIETELRAALAQASETIQPRADLADQVRRASRRRKHALTAAIAVGVAVTVGCLIAVYGAAPSPRHPSTDHHGKPPSGLQIVTTLGSSDLMAVSGRLIYVAEGDYPIAVLAAYDRITGRLIRHIGIPALPSVLQIGPTGLVWLAFYPDSNGGGTGVWLLSPDLRLRSAVNLDGRRYFGAPPFDVLPTGPDTAMLDTGRGLATLRLPPPGQPGGAAWRWEPPIPGARRISGLPVQVTPFAGRVAVRVGSDDAHGLISFSGQNSPVFSPGPADGVSSMAASGGDLWVTLFTRNGDFSRGLLRLNDQLRPTTPSSISHDPLFADRFAPSYSIAALGSTVWVILQGSPYLACFTDRGGRVGPVATLSPRNPPAVRLAAVGDTLYVLNSVGVASYRIPAACR